MGTGFLVQRGGSGGSGLNFKVVGGTTEPANPKENTIWVNTAQEIPEWTFSAENPYVEHVNLTVCATHAINSNSTDITIVDNSDNSVIASQTVIGTNHNSVFTDEVISFTTVSGLNGTLTCSVRPSTTPFFIGTVIVDSMTIDTVSFGTGINSSYEWNGKQTVSYEKYHDAKAGFVWILTGASSNVVFNALKKNGIQVYPGSAMQYIGGTWVAVAAYVRQNNKWSQFAYLGQYFIKNGKAVIKPTSQFNATIKEENALYKVSVTDASYHTAVNFPCNGLAGKIVHIVIDSSDGAMAVGAQYHSGLLLNTTELISHNWYPTFVAQVSINSYNASFSDSKEFTLPIPADFSNGYLTVSLTAPAGMTAYFNIKDMWIE